MHEIVLINSKKTLIVNLSGNINVDEAYEILSDFKKTIYGLNTNNYILIINPENISANIFVIPTLVSFMSLVSELKFKSIYVTNSDKYEAYIKQEIKKADSAVSLEFVANVDEALVKIKEAFK